MKRRLSVFLALVIVITFCTLSLPSCSDGERVYRQGNFEYTVENNEVTIHRYKGQSVDVIIPSTIKEMPVVAIGDSAFQFCDKMKTLTIPDSVVRIGTCAFANCLVLERVTLGHGIREIESSPFASCHNVIYNKYEDGYYIGNEENPYLALVCTASKGIETFTLHPNTVVVCGSAFLECNRLRELSLPENVVSLCGYALRDCSSLEKVHLSKNLELLGPLVFQNCDSIREITVPEENRHFKSVDGSLFSRDGTQLIKYTAAREVSSYRIPDGTVSIERAAFERALHLTEVVLPNSLDEIWSHGFADCEKLSSVQFGSGLKIIGSSAFSNSALTSVTVPDSVEEIHIHAFGHCEKLKSVTIGRGVTYMDGDILVGCDALQEVVFLDPTGWKIAIRKGHRKPQLQPADVSDPKRNVTYFTDTYICSHWEKE